MTRAGSTSRSFLEIQLPARPKHLGAVGNNNPLRKEQKTCSLRSGFSVFMAIPKTSTGCRNGEIGIYSMRMKMSFKLPVTVLKEDKRFVVYSPIIDLSTSGKTFEEAHKRFLEAAYLFFEEIVSKNTLNEVLNELGWKKVKNDWQPPVVIAQEQREVAVAL